MRSLFKRIYRDGILFVLSLLVTAIICYASPAKADTITYSNLVAGESITSDSPPGSRYNNYRPSTGTNWYRWVDKVEKTGGNNGEYNFKLDVPNDFAAGFCESDGIGGLLIKNQNNDEITGDWNDSGSANGPNGDFTQLYRVFDGGELDDDSKLRSDNYFTIEYICRVGSNNLATAVRTNGFEIAAGGELGGPWSSYVINTVDTPVPYSALPSYDISALSVSNGSISPTNASVKLGENQSFAITASYYYHISDIKTNGTSIGEITNKITSTNFVWKNVRDTGTIWAAFSPDIFTLNIESEYGNPSPRTTNVAYGTVVPVSIEDEVADTNEAGVKYLPTELK